MRDPSGARHPSRSERVAAASAAPKVKKVHAPELLGAGSKESKAGNAFCRRELSVPSIVTYGWCWDEADGHETDVTLQGGDGNTS